MYNLNEGLHNNNFEFEEHGVASLLPKSMNSRITKMLEKSSKVKGGSSSAPKYMLKKLLHEFETLEKFYSDKEYRNKLESAATYPSSEYFELERIYELKEKIKQKLNLPENSTIRYEKVKCCNDCRHNTHHYYYAYIWDCNSKKLKKKYIGKQLPLPTTITTI